MVKVLEHKVLYRERRFHAAFPSIARFSDDRLVLAFRRARDSLWLVPEAQRDDADIFGRFDHIDSRSHILLMELDADGSPLADAPDMLPVDPEAADQDPSLLVLPGDELLLGSFSWYPLAADAGALLAGRTPPDERAPGCRYIYWGSHSALRDRAPGAWRWHHRYLLPDGGYGQMLGADGDKALVAPVRGQPVWHDGEVLLPVYGLASDGCALFASGDKGLSWQYRGLIARDADQVITYQEPALCPDGQGGLVCFMRTAGADGRLASCRSKDGLHWSEPVLHELVGHPFHPLLLDDGRVLLSYGYRAEPYGIRARLLDDPLTDPDTVDEIVIRDDGVCPDLGYPWGVQLADGRLLLSYYWTDGQGIRQIMASWLAVSA